MTRSKTHHYVPQSLLKNFSIQGKMKQVYAFDKQDDSIRPHSVKNAGSEKFFYSIRKEGKELNFESLFQDADDRLAIIVTKIIEHESLEILDKQEQEFLINLTSLQILRTRESLNQSKKIQNTLVEISKRISKEWDVPLENFTPQIEEYDEEVSKTIFLDLDKSLKEFSSIIKSKIAYLCYTSDENPYWCSDNPVVYNNHLNFGDKGLGNKGTDIHFPISRNFIIVFACRSHLYQGPQKSQLLERANETEDRFIESINFKTKKNSQPENVLYYNSLQVRDSTRFVYSFQKNFDMAKSFLKDYPKHRNLSSNEIFSFERKPDELDYPNQPNGKYLSCNTKHAHHEIELEKYDLDNYTFKASNNEDFNSLAKETIIQEMKLIKNGNILFLLRGMRIKKLSEEERTFLAIFPSLEIEKIFKDKGK